MKTNTELLEWRGPENLLYGIEKQRRYLLRVESARKPCPYCASAQTAWEGRGFKNVDDYDLTKAQSDDGHCIECERPIRFVLPFMGDWHWAPVRSAVTVAAL